MTRDYRDSEANPLLNAPPRISDLKGDALTEALRERHDRHKQAWLQSRQHRPVRERVRGLVETLCNALPPMGKAREAVEARAESVVVQMRGRGKRGG